MLKQGALALLAMASALSLMLVSANAARGDTLDLSPQAAAACPACTTPTGAAQAVNLLAIEAPQDLSLTPPDDAPPPREGFTGAAERMAADAESLDQAVAAGGDGTAADDVERGIMNGLATSGAVPTAGYLCAELAYVCPIVFVGAAVAFVVVGPKLLNVFVDGGDSDTGQEITTMWWRKSDYEQTFLDPRGPSVHVGEWYLQYAYGDQQWSWMHHTGPSGCDFGPPAPRGVIVRPGVANICLNDMAIESYIRTDEMMFSARNPSKRVSSPPPGSNTVPAPPAPSRGAVADGTERALNKNLTFAAWINYELGTPGARDPISGKVIVPNCDGLSWTQCRDQMTGFGFATPVQMHVPDNETALAPEAAAGNVALVEGELTGRDPDDVLGVAVMPNVIGEPRTVPVPDIDVLVETDTDVTTETGDCDLSPRQPATGPVSGTTTFDPYPSLVGEPTTYSVNSASALALDDPPIDRPGETLLRVGAVRANGSGFGWRHIVARHGWTSKDEALTRLVLATPFHAIKRTTTRKAGDLDTYYGGVASGAWYYHRTATELLLCARRVVVKPDRLVQWGQLPQPEDGLLPAQTGIWTSYGKNIDTEPLP